MGRDCNKNERSQTASDSFRNGKRKWRLPRPFKSTKEVVLPSSTGNSFGAVHLTSGMISPSNCSDGKNGQVYATNSFNDRPSSMAVIDERTKEYGRTSISSIKSSGTGMSSTSIQTSRKRHRDLLKALDIRKFHLNIYNHVNCIRLKKKDMKLRPINRKKDTSSQIATICIPKDVVGIEYDKNEALVPLTSHDFFFIGLFENIFHIPFNDISNVSYATYCSTKKMEENGDTENHLQKLLDVKDSGLKRNKEMLSLNNGEQLGVINPITGRYDKKQIKLNENDKIRFNLLTASHLVEEPEYFSLNNSSRYDFNTPLSHYAFPISLVEACQLGLLIPGEWQQDMSHPNEIFDDSILNPVDGKFYSLNTALNMNLINRTIPQIFFEDKLISIDLAIREKLIDGDRCRFIGFSQDLPIVSAIHHGFIAQPLLLAEAIEYGIVSPMTRNNFVEKQEQQSPCCMSGSIRSTLMESCEAMNIIFTLTNPWSGKVMKMNTEEYMANGFLDMTTCQILDCQNEQSYSLSDGGLSYIHRLLNKEIDGSKANLFTLITEEKIRLLHRTIRLTGAFFRTSDLNTQVRWMSLSEALKKKRIDLSNNRVLNQDLKIWENTKKYDLLDYILNRRIPVTSLKPRKHAKTETVEQLFISQHLDLSTNELVGFYNQKSIQLEDALIKKYINANDYVTLKSLECRIVRQQLPYLMGISVIENVPFSPFTFHLYKKFIETTMNNSISPLPKSIHLQDNHPEINDDAIPIPVIHEKDSKEDLKKRIVNYKWSFVRSENEPNSINSWQIAKVTYIDQMSIILFTVVRYPYRGLIDGKLTEDGLIDDGKLLPKKNIENIHFPCELTIGQMYHSDLINDHSSDSEIFLKLLQNNLINRQLVHVRVNNDKSNSKQIENDSTILNIDELIEKKFLSTNGRFRLNDNEFVLLNTALRSKQYEIIDNYPIIERIHCYTFACRYSDEVKTFVDSLTIPYLNDDKTKIIQVQEKSHEYVIFPHDAPFIPDEVIHREVLPKINFDQSDENFDNYKNVNGIEPPSTSKTTIAYVPLIYDKENDSMISLKRWFHRTKTSEIDQLFTPENNYFIPEIYRQILTDNQLMNDKSLNDMIRMRMFDINSSTFRNEFLEELTEKDIKRKLNGNEMKLLNYFVDHSQSEEMTEEKANEIYQWQRATQLVDDISLSDMQKYFVNSRLLNLLNNSSMNSNNLNLSKAISYQIINPFIPNEIVDCRCEIPKRIPLITALDSDSILTTSNDEIIYDNCLSFTSACAQKLIGVPMLIGNLLQEKLIDEDNFVLINDRRVNLSHLLRNGFISMEKRQLQRRLNKKNEYSKVSSLKELDDDLNRESCQFRCVDGKWRNVLEAFQNEDIVFYVRGIHEHNRPLCVRNNRLDLNSKDGELKLSNDENLNNYEKLFIENEQFTMDRNGKKCSLKEMMERNSLKVEDGKFLIKIENDDENKWIDITEYCRRYGNDDNFVRSLLQFYPHFTKTLRPLTKNDVNQTTIFSLKSFKNPQISDDETLQRIPTATSSLPEMYKEKTNDFTMNIEDAIRQKLYIPQWKLIDVGNGKYEHLSKLIESNCDSIETTSLPMMKFLYNHSNKIFVDVMNGEEMSLEQLLDRKANENKKEVDSNDDYIPGKFDSILTDETIWNNKFHEEWILSKPLKLSEVMKYDLMDEKKKTVRHPHTFDNRQQPFELAILLKNLDVSDNSTLYNPKTRSTISLLDGVHNGILTNLKGGSDNEKPLSIIVDDNGKEESLKNAWKKGLIPISKPLLSDVRFDEITNEPIDPTTMKSNPYQTVKAHLNSKIPQLLYFPDIDTSDYLNSQSSLRIYGNPLIVPTKRSTIHRHPYLISLNDAEVANLVDYEGKLLFDYEMDDMEMDQQLFEAIRKNRVKLSKVRSIDRTKLYENLYSPETPLTVKDELWRRQQQFTCNFDDNTKHLSIDEAIKLKFIDVDKKLIRQTTTTDDNDDDWIGFDEAVQKQILPEKSLLKISRTLGDMTIIEGINSGIIDLPNGLLSVFSNDNTVKLYETIEQAQSENIISSDVKTILKEFQMNCQFPNEIDYDINKNQYKIASAVGGNVTGPKMLPIEVEKVENLPSINPNRSTDIRRSMDRVSRSSSKRSLFSMNDSMRLTRLSVASKLLSQQPCVADGKNHFISFSDAVEKNLIVIDKNTNNLKYDKFGDGKNMISLKEAMKENDIEPKLFHLLKMKTNLPISTNKLFDPINENEKKLMDVEMAIGAKILKSTTLEFELGQRLNYSKNECRKVPWLTLIAKECPTTTIYENEKNYRKTEKLPLISDYLQLGLVSKTGHLKDVNSGRQLSIIEAVASNLIDIDRVNEVYMRKYDKRVPLFDAICEGVVDVNTGVYRDYNVRTDAMSLSSAYERSFIRPSNDIERRRLLNEWKFKHPFYELRHLSLDELKQKKFVDLNEKLIRKKNNELKSFNEILMEMTFPEMMEKIEGKEMEICERQAEIVNKCVKVKVSDNQMYSVHEAIENGLLPFEFLTGENTKEISLDDKLKKKLLHKISLNMDETKYTKHGTHEKMIYDLLMEKDIDLSNLSIRKQSDESTTILGDYVPLSEAVKTNYMSERDVDILQSLQSFIQINHHLPSTEKRKSNKLYTASENLERLFLHSLPEEDKEEEKKSDDSIVPVTYVLEEESELLTDDEPKSTRDSRIMKLGDTRKLKSVSFDDISIPNFFIDHPNLTIDENIHVVDAVQKNLINFQDKTVQVNGKCVGWSDAVLKGQMDPVLFYLLRAPSGVVPHDEYSDDGDTCDDEEDDDNDDGFGDGEKKTKLKKISENLSSPSKYTMKKNEDMTIGDLISTNKIDITKNKLSGCSNDVIDQMQVYESIRNSESDTDEHVRFSSTLNHIPVTLEKIVRDGLYTAPKNYYTPAFIQHPTIKKIQMTIPEAILLGILPHNTQFELSPTFRYSAIDKPLKQHLTPEKVMLDKYLNNQLTSKDRQPLNHPLLPEVQPVEPLKVVEHKPYTTIRDNYDDFEVSSNLSTSANENENISHHHHPTNDNIPSSRKSHDNKQHRIHQNKIPENQKNFVEIDLSRVPESELVVTHFPNDDGSPYQFPMKLEDAILSDLYVAPTTTNPPLIHHPSDGEKNLMSLFEAVEKGILDPESSVEKLPDFQYNPLDKPKAEYITFRQLMTNTPKKYTSVKVLFPTKKDVEKLKKKKKIKEEEEKKKKKMEEEKEEVVKDNKNDVTSKLEKILDDGEMKEIKDINDVEGTNGNENNLVAAVAAVTAVAADAPRDGRSPSNTTNSLVEEEKKKNISQPSQFTQNRTNMTATSFPPINATRQQDKSSIDDKPSKDDDGTATIEGTLDESNKDLINSPIISFVQTQSSKSPHILEPSNNSASFPIFQQQSINSSFNDNKLMKNGNNHTPSMNDDNMKNMSPTSSHENKKDILEQFDPEQSRENSIIIPSSEHLITSAQKDNDSNIHFPPKQIFIHQQFNTDLSYHHHQISKPSLTPQDKNCSELNKKDNSLLISTPSNFDEENREKIIDEIRDKGVDDKRIVSSTNGYDDYDDVKFNPSNKHQESIYKDDCGNYVIIVSSPRTNNETSPSNVITTINDNSNSSERKRFDDKSPINLKDKSPYNNDPPNNFPEKPSTNLEERPSNNFEDKSPNNFQEKPSNNSFTEKSPNNLEELSNYFTEIPSNNFQDKSPKRFEEKPSNNLEEKPSNSLEKPSNNIKDQSPNNFQDIPANYLEQKSPKNFEEKPSNNLEENPSNNLEEKPSNNLEENPSNNFEEKPSNNLEENPSNNLEEKPSNNIKDESPNNFQNISSNNQEEKPSKDLEKPSNNFQEKPSNNFQEIPSNNLENKSPNNYEGGESSNKLEEKLSDKLKSPNKSQEIDEERRILVDNSINNLVDDPSKVLEKLSSNTNREMTVTNNSPSIIRKKGEVIDGSIDKKDFDRMNNLSNNKLMEENLKRLEESKKEILFPTLDKKSEGRNISNLLFNDFEEEASMREEDKKYYQILDKLTTDEGIPTHYRKLSEILPEETSPETLGTIDDDVLCTKMYRLPSYDELIIEKNNFNIDNEEIRHQRELLKERDVDPTTTPIDFFYSIVTDKNDQPKTDWITSVKDTNSDERLTLKSALESGVMDPIDFSYRQNTTTSHGNNEQQQQQQGQRATSSTIRSSLSYEEAKCREKIETLEERLRMLKRLDLQKRQMQLLTKELQDLIYTIVPSETVDDKGEKIFIISDVFDPKQERHVSVMEARKKGLLNFNDMSKAYNYGEHSFRSALQNHLISSIKDYIRNRLRLAHFPHFSPETISSAEQLELIAPPKFRFHVLGTFSDSNDEPQQKIPDIPYNVVICAPDERRTEQFSDGSDIGLVVNLRDYPTMEVKEAVKKGLIRQYPHYRYVDEEKEINKSLIDAINDGELITLQRYLAKTIFEKNSSAFGTSHVKIGTPPPTPKFPLNEQMEEKRELSGIKPNELNDELNRLVKEKRNRKQKKSKQTINPLTMNERFRKNRNELKKELKDFVFNIIRSPKDIFIISYVYEDIEHTKLLNLEEAVEKKIINLKKSSYFGRTHSKSHSNNSPLTIQHAINAGHIVNINEYFHKSLLKDIEMELVENYPFEENSLSHTFTISVPDTQSQTAIQYVVIQEKNLNEKNNLNTYLITGVRIDADNDDSIYLAPTSKLFNDLVKCEESTGYYYLPKNQSINEAISNGNMMTLQQSSMILRGNRTLSEVNKESMKRLIDDDLNEIFATYPPFPYEKNENIHLLNSYINDDGRMLSIEQAMKEDKIRFNEKSYEPVIFDGDDNGNYITVIDAIEKGIILEMKSFTSQQLECLEKKYENNSKILKELIELKNEGNESNSMNDEKILNEKELYEYLYQNLHLIELKQLNKNFLICPMGSDDRRFLTSLRHDRHSLPPRRILEKSLIGLNGKNESIYLKNKKTLNKLRRGDDYEDIYDYMRTRYINENKSENISSIIDNYPLSVVHFIDPTPSSSNDKSTSSLHTITTNVSSASDVLVLMYVKNEKDDKMNIDEAIRDNYLINTNHEQMKNSKVLDGNDLRLKINSTESIDLRDAVDRGLACDVRKFMNDEMELKNNHLFRSKRPQIMRIGNQTIPYFVFQTKDQKIYLISDVKDTKKEELVSNLNLYNLPKYFSTKSNFFIDESSGKRIPMEQAINKGYVIQLEDIINSLIKNNDIENDEIPKDNLPENYNIPQIEKNGMEIDSEIDSILSGGDDIYYELPVSPSSKPPQIININEEGKGDNVVHATELNPIYLEIEEDEYKELNIQPSPSLLHPGFGTICESLLNKQAQGQHSQNSNSTMEQLSSSPINMSLLIEQTMGSKPSAPVSTNFMSMPIVDEKSVTHQVAFVFDGHKREKYSCKDAIQNSTIDPSNGTYYNHQTGEKMPISMAINHHYIVTMDEIESKCSTQLSEISPNHLDMISPLSLDDEMKMMKSPERIDDEEKIKDISNNEMNNQFSLMKNSESLLTSYTNDSNRDSTISFDDDDLTVYDEDNIIIIHKVILNNGIECPPLKATQLGILDKTTGEYMDEEEGLRLSIIDAINEGLIYATINKNDEYNSKQTTTNSFQESIIQFNVLSVIDPRTEKEIDYLTAKREGILNTTLGLYKNPLDYNFSPISINEAMQRGLINAEVIRSQKSFDLFSAIVIFDALVERVKRKYSITTVIHPNTKKPISGQMAVKEGILDVENNSFTISKHKHLTIQEAVDEKFLDATVDETIERKPMKLSFQNAVLLKLFRPEYGTFTDYFNQQSMTLYEAIEREHLDKNSIAIASSRIGPMSLMKAIDLRLFDRVTGGIDKKRFNEMDASIINISNDVMKYNFEDTIKCGLLNLKTGQFYDIENNQSISVKEAVNKNLIDGTSTIIQHPITKKRLTLKNIIQTFDICENGDIIASGSNDIRMNLSDALYSHSLFSVYNHLTGRTYLPAYDREPLFERTIRNGRYNKDLTFIFTKTNECMTISEAVQRSLIQKSTGYICVNQLTRKYVPLKQAITDGVVILLGQPMITAMNLRGRALKHIGRIDHMEKEFNEDDTEDDDDDDNNNDGDDNDEILSHPDDEN
ncbi:hypothetical protein SNEBB_001019 [Seison nebaliae]|nr:hypothetical protein SNEBB_001019 [Seison nebaliae]